MTESEAVCGGGRGSEPGRGQKPAIAGLRAPNSAHRAQAARCPLMPTPHTPLVAGLLAPCVQDRETVGYRLCSRRFLLYTFVKMELSELYCSGVSLGFFSGWLQHCHLEMN